MTVLYYTAAYLAAHKIIDDLDAFTETSTRVTDLLAFAVLGMFLGLLAQVAV